MGRRILSFFLWAACGLAAQEHAGHYSQPDIERGLRLYGANCAPCHGLNGEQVQGVNLRAGKFRRVSTDEELGRVVVSGIPGTAMPPHKFDASELTGIIAYLRTMADDPATNVAIGDAAHGQALFEGKGQCLKCHRVRGNGSRLAPDLTEIGAVRTPDRIQKSLLDPTAAMLPMNRFIQAVTRDGKKITGRRLNEDTYSVQIIDDNEHLVSLIKADLREYTIIKSSPMPSVKSSLSSVEVADLVAYLLSLKGGN